MKKKTYQITFKAELSEDDVRAMKKCFYDAMLDAMEISPVWDLKLEPAEDPDTELPEWPEIKEEEKPSLDELLKLPLRHIQDIKNCFEACKSRADVAKVIKMAPGMFGTWSVSFDDEYHSFIITNTYWDDDLGDLEDEYWYDYPEDWDFDEEEDN